jgi:hypothetical protein
MCLQVAVEVGVGDMDGIVRGLVVDLSNESPQLNWRDFGTRNLLAAGIMNQSAHQTVLATSMMGGKCSRTA